MKRFALLLGLLLCSPALADDHVVVLLDTSGSMRESMHRVRMTKMEAAKAALQNVVDRMPASTQMGLVTFNGWAFPLGPVDKPKATQAIANMSATGGTPLGEYLKVAADALLDVRQKNRGIGTYTLLVVTDGEATDGDLMDRYTPDIASRGLTLKTIGVNLDKAHTLALHSVAYFSADDPTSLSNALSKAVAEVPSGNDNISEDAYAMISGIPDQMTTEVLKAVSDTITRNQPIGEAPKVKVVDEQGNVTYVQTPVTETPTSGDSGWGILGIVLAIAFGVFLLVVVIIVLGRESY